MLSKSIETLSTLNRPRVFVEEPSYDLVIQFIKNNTAINQAMPEFSSSEVHQKKIQNLLVNLQNGHLQEAIFTDENCALYNLYLLKNNKISLEHFLTAHIYLTVLMLYTDKQNLKEKDRDLKKITEVSLASIEDIIEKLTCKLDSTHFKNFLSRNMTQPEKDRLQTDFETLLPLEKVVIRIKKPDKLQDDVDKQTERYFNSPFLLSDKNFYYIPSVTAIQIMIKLINPAQVVKVAPIFGKISLATLLKIHQNGYHPVALYAPFVESNPEAIHGKRGGPLAALLHDLGGHIYFGNLLNKNIYQFLFSYLIPKMMNDTQLNNKPLKEEKGKLLSLLSIIDLNFTDIEKEFLAVNLAHGVLRLNSQDNPTENENAFIPLIDNLLQQHNQIKEAYDIDVAEFFNHGLYEDLIEQVKKSNFKISATTKP